MPGAAFSNSTRTLADRVGRVGGAGVLRILILCVAISSAAVGLSVSVLLKEEPALWPFSLGV